MEIVGKYPTIEDEVEFSVGGDVPVWLPTTPTFPQFTGEIRDALVFLRKDNIFFLFLSISVSIVKYKNGNLRKLLSAQFLGHLPIS